MPTGKPKKRWIVPSLITVCCLIVFSLYTYINKQYAAGNTIYASPEENLSNKVSSLTPGDTLILRDGMYANQNLRVEGLRATAAALVIIKAENDGKAVIDGGRSGNPLFINNSSYITVEGIVARNGQEPVVVTGSSNQIIIRRVTAYNAAPGNRHVFDVKFGPTNVLIEDCAGWGRGRYIFIAYRANNVTFRRTWARWEKTENFTPAPRSNYGAYSASNISFENVIGHNTRPVDPTDDYYSGAWITSDGPTTEHVGYYGAIFYNIWGQGIRVNDLQAYKNTIIKDSYFSIPLLPDKPAGYPNSRPRSVGVEWLTPIGGTITHSVFANNRTAIAQGNGVPTVTNNVFINNTTAIDGNTRNNNNVFWNNDINSSALDTSDKQINPTYDTNRYGTGAYFFVPQNSPLKTAGGNIGANIIYAYENRQLTNKPLWPWPMEDRIRAEKGVSVTWASNGGFWKTLEGVYDGKYR